MQQLRAAPINIWRILGKPIVKQRGYLEVLVSPAHVLFVSRSLAKFRNMVKIYSAVGRLLNQYVKACRYAIS